MYDAIYLSPHLDDAVLSCGGRIADEVTRGENVLAVTLFTADEPRAAPSRLAADLRRWWSLPPGQVMSARRREDIEAIARLGAECLHLGLPEAPYRLGAGGAPFYTELARLFGPPDPEDTRTLLAVLAERLETLPPTQRLVVPLAVGGHVDHRLVRAAVEASGRAALFYEEFPYSEWKWFALRRALGRPREWRSETLPLPERLFEAKIGAILAYESQVPAMFRSEARLRKQLRRYLRRAGGERLWLREEAR